MKMDNVFHADRLRKAANDPLPDQIQDPEPPTEVNSQPEYTVERILASRIRNNILQYQVNWKGYNPDSEWYNADGFIGSPQKIKDYHDAYPNKAGPPRRLQVWLDAYKSGEELDPTDEDNMAVNKGPKKHSRQRI